MAKTQTTNKGNLLISNNREKVQVGSSFITYDATGTPVTSPLSLTTTAVFTIIVPDNAVLMTVLCASDIRVSDIVGMTYYDLVKGGSKEVYHVAKMQNVYVCNDTTGTNNLYFKFIVL